LELIKWMAMVPFLEHVCRWPLILSVQGIVRMLLNAWQMKQSIIHLNNLLDCAHIGEFASASAD